jgi:hypothetical protein
VPSQWAEVLGVEPVFVRFRVHVHRTQEVAFEGLVRVRSPRRRYTWLLGRRRLRRRWPRTSRYSSGKHGLSFAPAGARNPSSSRTFQGPSCSC